MGINFYTSGAGVEWYSRYGDQRRRCAMNGRAIVAGLQTALRSFEIPASPSYDGVTVRSSDVVVDGQWGATTTRVFWVAMRRIGATRGVLDAIARTGRERAINQGAMASAITVVASTDEVWFGDLPVVAWLQWNVAGPLPSPGTDRPSCIVSVENTANRVEPAPLPADATPVPTTPGRPRAPVRGSEIAVQASTDTARTPRTQPRPGGGRQGASVGWGLLGLALAGVGVVWALGESVKKDTRRRVPR